MPMPTREQVLVLLDSGHTYEMAGRELGIPAGRAFMIATGLPADGSDDPSLAARHYDAQQGAASPQRLVNPLVAGPTANEGVLRWVRDRAARQLRQDG